MKSTTFSSPSPVFGFVKTNGRSPRVLVLVMLVAVVVVSAVTVDAAFGRERSSFERELEVERRATAPANPTRGGRP